METLPKVSTKRLTNDSWRRFARVFQMVHELHKVGYQGLRVDPQRHHSRIHLSPSIFMTHAETHGVVTHPMGLRVEQIANDYPTYHSGIKYEINSAQSLTAHQGFGGDDYFNWGDGSGKNSRQLANMFVERFPNIARLSFLDDYEYAGWFQRLIGEIENGWMPSVPRGLLSRYLNIEEPDTGLRDGVYLFPLEDEFREAEPLTDDNGNPIPCKLLLYEVEWITGDDVRTFPLPPPVAIDGDDLHRLVRMLLTPLDQDERPTGGARA